MQSAERKIITVFLLAVVIAFLDAISTYYIISCGKGYEINPLFQEFNINPTLAFFHVHHSILAATVAAVGLAILSKLNKRVYTVMLRVYTASLLLRAAIVTNNFAILFS